MECALFDLPTPTMERLDPSRCSVGRVGYDAVRQVVAETHYIGRPGATSVGLGLYVDGVIAGVITFGTIPKNNATAVCGPLLAGAVMELTRLALYDWAPRNSESWLISRALKWLASERPDVRIVVSYADSAQGHVGTVYQATNWVYTGMTTSDYVYQPESGGPPMHPRTTARAKGELPSGRWVPSAAKHRYVAFVGSPRERRDLRRLLRWEPQPYPKDVR